MCEESLGWLGLASWLAAAGWLMVGAGDRGYYPEVVLGLHPVLLNAKVVDKGGATRVHHIVEKVDDWTFFKQK